MAIVSGGGGGGGRAGPSVVAFVNTAFDVHTANTYTLNWDRLATDVSNVSPLSSLPAGLGLSFAHDGSNGTITVTSAGTWAFTVYCFFADGPDAGFRCTLSTAWNSFGQEDGPINVSGNVTLTEILTLPASASGVYSLGVAVGTATNPFRIQPWLSIVRLA